MTFYCFLNTGATLSDYEERVGMIAAKIKEYIFVKNDFHYFAKSIARHANYVCNMTLGGECYIYEFSMSF
jgi:hypothetical protein